MVDLKLILES